VAMGTAPAQGHWRVAVHGEVAWPRRNSTPASNRAQPRADKGKIGAGVGWLPRGESPGPLNGDRDTTRPWVNGGGGSMSVSRGK
jgi:hypothetical protein